MRALILAIRILSYLALALNGTALAAAVYVSESGGCPRYDAGAVRCLSPFHEQVAGIALFVLLGSAFTVVPATLAVAGLIFFVRDLTRLLRGRAGRVPT